MKKTALHILNWLLIATLAWVVVICLPAVGYHFSTGRQISDDVMITIWFFLGVAEAAGLILAGLSSRI